MRRLRVNLASAIAVAMATGCVYLPQTTSHYNADCQIEARHMALEQYQVATLAGCSNNDCVVLLVALGVVSAASAVVSGSIVVTGNVVYWLEEKANCLPPNKTEDPAPVSGQES